MALLFLPAKASSQPYRELRFFPSASKYPTMKTYPSLLTRLFNNHSIRLSVALLIGGTLASQAQTAYNWNLNNAGNWDAAANWNPNTGYPSIMGDSATFPAAITTANRVVTVGTPVTISALTFNDNHAITVGGTQAITFQVPSGNATLSVDNTGSNNGAHIISAPLIFASDLTMSKNTTSTFTVSTGGITNNGAWIFNQNGTGATTFSGPVTNNGSWTINQNGTGAITVSGLTTLTGPLTITSAAGAGSVTLSGATTFSGNVNVTNNSSNTILFSGVPSGTGLFNISGSGTGLTELRGNGTYACDIIVNAGAILRMGATPLYSGNLSCAGQFRKGNNFGTIQMTGNITSFTGSFLIETGQIRIDTTSWRTALPDGIIDTPADGATFWRAAGHGVFTGYTPADQTEAQDLIDKFTSRAYAKVGYIGNFGDTNTVLDFTGHTLLSLSAGPLTGDDLTYNGSLTVAAGEPYRLGGASTITLTKENALTGDHGLIITQGGSVRFTASQNFTGGTIVGLPAWQGGGGGNMQLFADPSTVNPFGSGGLFVRGGLEAVGANGTFIGLTTPVTWQDGAFITFDNREAVNNDRYGDATALTMTANRHGVQLRGNLTTPCSEQIGAVTLGNGFGFIYPWVEYSATAADPTRTDPAAAYLKMASLTLNDPNMFVRITSVPIFNTIPTEDPDAYLGDEARVIITDPTALATLTGSISNGMLPPAYFDPSVATFLTYDSTVVGSDQVGFKNAPFTNTDNLASAGIADLALVTTTTTLNGVNPNVYALKITGPINKTAAETITIGSGGLITNLTAASTSSANLTFSDRAFLLTGTNNFTTSFSGVISAPNGMTKGGNRQINFTSASNMSGILGDLVLAEGTLELGWSGVGTVGNGSLNLNVYAGNTLRVRSYHGTDGTYDWNFGNLTGAGSVFYDSSGNSRHSNLVLNITQDSVFDGNITSNAGTSMANKLIHLVKNGSGKLTMTGINVLDKAFGMNGTITVNAGTLELNNVKTVANTVTVNVNGTLSGVGTIPGPVTNNGTVAPGSSAGTLNLTGTYAQTSGGTLAIELGGLSAGQFDVLAVGTTATIDGAVTVTPINGFVPTNGDSWIILTAGTSITGTFASLPANYTATYGANSVTLTYNVSAGYNGWAGGEGVGAADEDDDGDGILNGVEYAFNLDPNVPDADSTDYSNLSGAAVDVGSHLQFSYLRPATLPGDVSIVVRFSNDLVNWVDGVLGSNYTQVVTGTDPQTVAVTLVDPLSTYRFAHVAYVITP